LTTTTPFLSAPGSSFLVASNSPVRAFRAVGGTPRFIQRAQGAHFWDANGRKYIDYIGSWGPMILGHGHPDVVEAVQKAVTQGFSFGAPTEREIELAEEILKHLPSMEMLRLVSSGTEAGMSAIPAGARRYRTQQDHQVRRLLPRPCR